MTTKTRARRTRRNPQRTKREAYRWFKVKEETWAKVERLTQRMQQDPGAYPFRLSVNRVASMEFEKAIDALPE